MTTLAELRPLTKNSVYEVLHQLDFDLSGWAVNARGKPNKNPAVNGRAYAWSYEDARSGQDIFMLWHEDMTESEGRVHYLQNWQDVVAELERTRPMTARRADSFLRHVAKLKPGAVVRVGIVEGSRAKSSDEDSSRVAKRMLDTEVWHLSRWEPAKNTYEFTRGLPPDQLSPGADSSVSTLPLQPPVGTVVADDDAETQMQSDIAAIMADDISATEKERLIAARLGQGRFRADVLARWRGACAVTGSTTLAAIRASHCMPWRAGTRRERLDPANGLPLVATLDALFDVGLITFQDDGCLTVSPRLKDEALDLRDLTLRRRPDTGEMVYLDYHRRVIFRKE
jgi:hypothetical protein